MNSGSYRLRTWDTPSADDRATRWPKRDRGPADSGTPRIGDPRESVRSYGASSRSRISSQASSKASSKSNIKVLVSPSDMQTAAATWTASRAIASSRSAILSLSSGSKLTAYSRSAIFSAATTKASTASSRNPCCVAASSPDTLASDRSSEARRASALRLPALVSLKDAPSSLSPSALAPRSTAAITSGSSSSAMPSHQRECPILHAAQRAVQCEEVWRCSGPGFTVDMVEKLCSCSLGVRQGSFNLCQIPWR